MDRYNYLVHHGILGQKWGVRRFQNYDGTYTKKGLERYNKSIQLYDDAKESLRSAKATGSKADIKNAKKQVKVAKHQLNKNYDKLATDKLADQGKELYKKGKTIEDIRKKTLLTQIGITAYGTLAASAITKIGLKYVGKHGSIPVSKLAASTIVTGESVANIMLSYKEHRDTKRLRAYYAH